MARPKKEQEDARAERLSRICAEINKGAFGGENKDAVTWLGSRDAVDIDRFSSADPGMDEALGGGWPKGRFVEIFGPESGGKTTLVLHAIAEHQRKYPDEDCALIDTEYSFDEAYAAKVGVNAKYLIVHQPDSGEQALNILKLLMQNGVRCIVVDSVAALTTKNELEGDIGDVHVGEQARLMSGALRQLATEAGKRNATVFWTNQIREKIGVMYGDRTTTPAGRALRHYASIRVHIRAIGKVKEKVGGEDVIVSSRNKIDVKKNKCVASGEVMFIPNEGRCYYIDELVGRDGFGVTSLSGSSTNNDGSKMYSIEPTMAKRCIAQSVEPCVEVGVRGIGSLITNLEHPYLTPSGYVQAQNLRPRDLVAAVVRLPIPMNDSVGKDWTVSRSRLVGMLCGDGCVGGDTGIALRNFSPGCVDAFRQCSEDFGCEVYEKKDQPGLWVVRQEGGGHKGQPSPMNDFLRDHLLFGKKAETKEVPPTLFACDSDVVGGFIGGLIATDGWVCEEGNGRWVVGLSTVSKKLAEGVRHLLLRHGIVSCVSRRDPRKGGVVNGRQIEGKKDSYVVRVRKTADVQALRCIVPWSDGKMDDIPAIPNNSRNSQIEWKRVKSVKPAGSRMTYDICESGYENFEIHGLITHNTAPPFKTAEFCISFGHGIDSIAAILDMAIAMKIVEKRGAWFSFDGIQVGQGRAATLDFLRKDTETTKKVSDAISAAKAAGVEPELASDVEPQDPDAGADPDAVGGKEDDTEVADA